MSESSAPSTVASPFSHIPGRPSFRSSALNAVAMVPLLSTNKEGGENSSHSSMSFKLLLESLKRYASSRGNDGNMAEVPLDTPANTMDDLLVVVPNAQLTRPGDWRYDQTPLRSFHWGNGCQRMLCFDGRPHKSRMAHDRLLNSVVGRDWIDIMPSRRTAAVVGVLNMKDIPTLEAFAKAQHELQQWAERYSTPPYEVTAHGRNFARDGVVQRLFVFDSFDEECQKRIDLTKLGSSMIAFPPSDDAHHHMMDLHLNVVLNDLAVAIFRQLETKIQESDSVGRNTPSLSFNVGSNRNQNKKPDGPVNSNAMSIKHIASVVNPENQLAAAVQSEEEEAKNPVKNARKAFSGLAESAGKLMNTNKKHGSAPQLLTPLDDVWDPSELSPRDAEAMKKRDVGRREKLAADLSLLAGSPIDAYERYTRAAELTKEAHDPLWYTSSLQGCAAAFCAMAEAGGHCVDEYLNNNFQFPEDIMGLAFEEKDANGGRKATPLVVDKSKTTLPAAVFALCEEALSITNRHPKLAAFHAELLLKLAWYTAEMEASHLRCLWGQGEACYEGDVGEPKRWERTTVSKLNLDALGTKEGKELLSTHTFTRCQKWTDLMHRAVSTGALDPRTRADVAAACARMCLVGMKATEWRDGEAHRLKLNRKAAFCTVVAAEALSQCQDDSRAGSLWLAACQSYTRTGNSYEDGAHYGWATLRASVLHALSQQHDHISAEAAVELLLALLSGVSTDRASDAVIHDRIPSSDDAGSVVPMSDDSRHSLASHHNSGHGSVGIGEGRPIPDESPVPTYGSRRSSNSRTFFSSATATSSLLTVAQSKWTDDEPIPSLPLPLVDPNHIAMGSRHGTMDASLSRSLISLNSVLPKIHADSCGMAQKRCLALIADLRQEMPTISALYNDSLQKETFPIYGSNATSVPPPLQIVSAKAVKSESHLLLERSKAAGFSGRATGVMATFFNPFDNKKKQAEKKVQPTLVAEGEERAVLIEFANCLSVPLAIPSCQVEFKASDSDRIKAPPLSFVVPAKATNFAVHFPFFVLDTSTEDNGGKKSSSKTEVEDEGEEDAVVIDVFEVIGLRATCLNRSFFIPIGSSESQEKPKDEATESLEKQVPDAASVYQKSNHNKPKKKEEQTRPAFEAVPSQPHLHVSFTTSQTPIEDGTTVPVHLSDGEIFTIPSFRLQNDFGPSGMGVMERLQIVGVGLPGMPEEILYDTDEMAAAQEEEEMTDSDDEQDESTGFEELMEADGLPPLKMKAICEGLSLTNINDKSKATGSTVMFQVAATHDMGNQLANGGNVRIRFRYRGRSPNPATEIWRKREVSLRIIRVKGPRISSLTFRSDLSWGSSYSELCQSLAKQKIQREQVVMSESAAPGNTETTPAPASEYAEETEAKIEDSVLKRVGLDMGVHVSGNDVVVLMAVANETNSTIILSNRKGLVGGFEGSPMPTVRVTSGVSVKIPVVIPRIERIADDDTVADIATELVARTALQWETEAVDEDGNKNEEARNRRRRQGRVRIPSRCLREIIAEHQSFAARICKPPVSIKVSVTGKNTGLGPEKQLVVSPGTPLDAHVEMETADWVPEEIMANCAVTVEFCCARKGDTMGRDHGARPYIWCGQVMRKMGAKDTDKNHCARIAFMESGTFVVSACAHVCNKNGTGTEETWWAPQAENVQVSLPTPSA